MKNPEDLFFFHEFNGGLFLQKHPSIFNCSVTLQDVQKESGLMLA